MHNFKLPSISYQREKCFSIYDSNNEVVDLCTFDAFGDNVSAVLLSFVESIEMYLKRIIVHSFKSK